MISEECRCLRIICHSPAKPANKPPDTLILETGIKWKGQARNRWWPSGGGGVINQEQGVACLPLGSNDRPGALVTVSASSSTSAAPRSSGSVSFACCFFHMSSPLDLPPPALGRGGAAGIGAAAPPDLFSAMLCAQSQLCALVVVAVGINPGISEA